MIKKYSDKMGLTWLVVEWLETKTGEQIKEAFNLAICERGGFYTNIYYPIILNSNECFVWKNTKGYFHFIMAKDRCHYSINSKDQIKESAGFIDFNKILEHVKDDNIYLSEHGQFDNLEVKEAL